MSILQNRHTKIFLESVNVFFHFKKRFFAKQFLNNILHQVKER